MNDVWRRRLEKIAKVENCDGDYQFFETRRWGPIAIAVKQQDDGTWRGIWSIFGVAQQLRGSDHWSKEAFVGALLGDATEFCSQANQRHLLGQGGVLKHG